LTDPMIPPHPASDATMAEGECLASTDAGIVAIWDPAAFTHIDGYEAWEAALLEEEDIGRHINAGHLVPISIGGDGAWQILVRMGTANIRAVLSDRKTQSPTRHRTAGPRSRPSIDRPTDQTPDPALATVASSVPGRCRREGASMNPVKYETGRARDADPSNVQTREDFADFLGVVLADFRSTGAAEWENGTLERFLDGFAAFAEARVVDQPEQEQEQASWRLFAEIVRTATGYE
jgi:hypothetical protein